MNERHRAFAVGVVKTLRTAGFQALFAGGCVRDLLLGESPSDFDVATDATPEAVMRLFRHTVPVGVSFGVVRVIGSKEQGEIEVATFRSDGEYLDGRRPDTIAFASPEVDAHRRDFTINGMFYDPLKEEVIDYVGGREDLNNRVLRAIGDPFSRFREDKLRLLRAVRFTARLGFALDPQTEAAIHQMASQIKQVSVERIVEELRKMFVHPTRVLAVEWIRNLNLLEALLPGLSPRTDSENWSETIRVLTALPRIVSFPLAMAALLRRLGSVEAIDSVLGTWKLSNADRDRIDWLLQHEQALVNAESIPRSRLKRLLSAPGIDELLALHRAIAEASSSDLKFVLYCEEYRTKLPEGPLDPPFLVTGRDLIEAGLKPGPKFSTMLEQIRDAQLEGTIQTKEEGLKLIRSE
jgi:tRNA nucleotidyltransferase/poly(A) polymerase